MIYTVGEAAKQINVAASTLRYYDKEGLLPFLERSGSGIRMFKDDDLAWLKTIDCLKKPECLSRILKTSLIIAWRVIPELMNDYQSFKPNAIPSFLK